MQGTFARRSILALLRYEDFTNLTSYLIDHGQLVFTMYTVQFTLILDLLPPPVLLATAKARIYELLE